MSRLGRFGVLALMILVLDVLPVGARWVRLGDAGTGFQANANCLDVNIDFYIDTSRGGLLDVMREVETYAKMYRIRPEIKQLNENRGEHPELAGALVGQAPTLYYQHAEPINFEDAPKYQLTYVYASGTMQWHPQFSNEFPYVVIFGNTTALSDSIPGTSNWSIAAYSKDEYDALCSTHENFTDGRVNAYDPWESATAYCEDKMVKVYGINAEANGYFAFAITQADIDKLGIPNVNTLLTSAPSAFGGDIRLYKLKDTGELQINAPGLPPESWKEYVFTWAGCS